jgi:hypothetical protein
MPRPKPDHLTSTLASIRADIELPPVEAEACKVVIYMVVRVWIGGAAGRPVALALAVRHAGLESGADVGVLLSGPAGS